MSDVVAAIASKIGISPEQAEKGLGVLLTGLKKFAPDLYAKVSPYIPESGAAETAFASAADGASSGGLMGSIAGMAGKLFGGETGEAAELMQMFSKAGFSLEQVKEFAPAALSHLKTVLPPELVDQICSQVPGLDKVS